MLSLLYAFLITNNHLLNVRFIMKKHKMISHLILQCFILCTALLSPQPCFCLIEEEAHAKFEKMRQSADNGNAVAQYRMCIFYHGINDKEKEVKYCTMSASQNYPPALSTLGTLYYLGRGVPQDYKKAKEYSEKACKLGDVEACRHLGQMYYSGEGVKKDYDKAFKLIQFAAFNNDRSAGRILGLMYLDGIGVEKNIILGRSHIESAAKQGDEDAMTIMGIMYEKGLAMKCDYKKAKEWYGKACDAGDEVGCNHYKRLDSEGY